MGPLKPLHKLHNPVHISSNFQAYFNKFFLATAGIWYG